MKPVGALVKFTARHWEGSEPEFGLFLRTSRGRWYEIINVRHTPRARILTCVVRGYDFKPPAAAPTGWWKFNARGRKSRGRAPVL